MHALAVQSCVFPFVVVLLEDFPELEMARARNLAVHASVCIVLDC